MGPRERARQVGCATSGGLTHMTNNPCRLLCIDLQADAIPGCEPDPAAMLAARNLISAGRRLGWTIAHTRRRTLPVIRARNGSQAPSVNPLMSEQVFFHDGRSVAEAYGLPALLRTWREETVLVAAFDPVALLSCVLACQEPGPRLLLVEDVMPMRTLESAARVGIFHGEDLRGAFKGTTLAKLVKDAGRATGVHVLPLPEGQRPGL